MSSKIRNVALLLPAFVLATGLASAQPGVKVSSINNGSVSTTTISNDPSSGPTAKAPAVDANGLAKYWDGLGTGGASTNYFSTPPFITATPNPQIAVGPDDILTIVNRTISRFPNPNAAGNTGVANPYNNPPTEYVWLDAWIGIPTLGPVLCPSGTSSNTQCVIDNASIRYDQLQGRFVVLFTVTDVPNQRSNFVLIVSKFSQFTKCAAGIPTCVPNGASSPLFTPPVIAPIVGGTQTGGINASNWVMYTIPINLTYVTAPTAVGNGLAGVASSVPTGGGTGAFVTATDCGTNGGPSLPLTPGAGGTARSCTNYYPTSARMGIDNDNIILTASVLDQSFATNEHNFPSVPGQSQGPYAGTRTVSISKFVVYNGTSLSLVQPPACTGDSPIDCMAVNLADNVITGTITAKSGCTTASAPPAPPAGCSPTTPLPAIFFEPDNLRGRALASFDSQVSPVGIITPIDYLVGTLITDNYGNSTGLNGNQFFIQPIVFSCPGVPIFPGPAGVAFCGVGGGTQVPDLPLLATLKTNVSTLAQVADPNPVGQGFSATQMTTNPLNTPVQSTTNNRLFVGDDRPQQVMFREGLLYVARTVRLFTSQGTSSGAALGTSTVLYDLIKTCATAAAQPNCGGFNINGTGFGAPALALETEWFNGTNVPDPAGNVTGFGFYQPMFESPADVISSGPVSPISLLPWFDKLFVGMTTGGTANVSNTFSKNFPSLWDFRPGDDAFDTVEPYLDPFTGLVIGSVSCGTDITVLATVTKNSTSVVVNDTTGLAVGQFLNSTSVATIPATITAINTSTNTVTLSSAYTGNTSTLPLSTSLTFTRVQPLVTTTATLTIGGTSLPAVAPSNVITVASAAGLQIGQLVVSAGATTNKIATVLTGNTSILLNSTSSVGVGESVIGGTFTQAVQTTAGSAIVQVPTTTQVAVGEGVSGTGIPANTYITAIAVNPDATLQVTLNNAATATTAVGSTVTLTFSTNCNVVSNPVTVPQTIPLWNCPGQTAAAPVQFFAAGAFVATPPDISNHITVSAPGTGSSFVGTNPLTSLPISNGIPVIFTAANFFVAPTTIININGTTVTLSSNAVSPAGLAPPIATGTVLQNLPITFQTSTTLAQTSCPMIPFSTRGGASTDPNDGSLWLYGQFAKNRLSTIPGPGQWGTSVANYPLSFPATDPYNNDNTFFQDVQPGNGFFTWIQIAKNLGIAVPSATGPCVINNGGTPIQNPPAPGTTPVASPSNLVCPYFNPTATVNRAEMAYWVVRAQMDEPQITAYLNATGGDPTVGGFAAQGSFSDYGTVSTPFLAGTVTTSQLIRDIEVMYRRGYTKGCSSTDDPLRRYCPNDLVTRAQMSVFLIRAKMNNVFPTTLSGIPVLGPYGDNFGLFQQATPYFSDVTSGATDPYKDYYIYVQKMRELRITNGTSGSLFSPGNNLTRQEIATFIVRAFFL
jgi:hypothetical protein